MCESLVNLYWTEYEYASAVIIIMIIGISCAWSNAWTTTVPFILFPTMPSHKVGVLSIPYIPTLPQWDPSVDCSFPHSILLGYQYWPFRHRNHSYPLSRSDELHLLSLVDCKCLKHWLLSLTGEQPTTTTL